MSELLHYKFAGDRSRPCIVIVHGLFGTLDNWQSLSRKWSETYFVISLDVRNHGRSFHSDHMEFVECAEDILKVLEAEGIELCHIIGHSMGGKIAMEFAAQYSHRLMSLIIIDVAPYPYTPHHTEVLNMLSTICLDHYASRQDIELAISNHLNDPSIVQFMMKNIKRNEENLQFEWKFNQCVLLDNYTNIIQFMPSNGYSGRTLFIGGDKSDYITKNTSIYIFDLYPNAEIEFVSNAGHWVHADNPDELSSLIFNFLSF